MELVKLSNLAWNKYFMDIAQAVSKKSSCIRKQVGCILVKDKRIISTGFNGTPKGLPNCNDDGCPRCNDPFVESGKDLDKCLCCHAEENAIVQAAYHGVSIKDSVLYTTFYPCVQCSKMILNSGIKKVVFSVKYPSNNLLFENLEIEVVS